MSTFDDLKDHNHSNYIFDKNKQKEILENEPDFKCIDLGLKIGNRLENMIKEYFKSCQSSYTFQSNSVQAMISATELEALAAKLMGIPVPMEKMVGVTICHDCLDRAINATSEMLAILKDIQETIKAQS